MCFGLVEKAVKNTTLQFDVLLLLHLTLLLPLASLLSAYLYLPSCLYANLLA